MYLRRDAWEQIWAEVSHPVIFAGTDHSSPSRNSRFAQSGAPLPRRPNMPSPRIYSSAFPLWVRATEQGDFWTHWRSQRQSSRALVELILRTQTDGWRQDRPSLDLRRQRAGPNEASYWSTGDVEECALLTWCSNRTRTSGARFRLCNGAGSRWRSIGEPDAATERVYTNPA